MTKPDLLLFRSIAGTGGSIKKACSRYIIMACIEARSGQNFVKQKLELDFERISSSVRAGVA